MRRAQEQGPWQEKELLNEAPFMQSPKAINNQAAAQQLVQRMVWAGAALGRSSIREHPTGRTLSVREEPYTAQRELQTSPPYNQNPQLV